MPFSRAYLTASAPLISFIASSLTFSDSA